MADKAAVSCLSLGPMTDSAVQVRGMLDGMLRLRLLRWEVEDCAARFCGWCRS